jgi:hypothetical protein
MTEEGDHVETERVKDADPKEVEPITSELLKETKKKTSKTKNIKVIPLASELDHGLKPDESGGGQISTDLPLKPLTKK